MKKLGRLIAFFLLFINVVCVFHLIIIAQERTLGVRPQRPVVERSQEKPQMSAAEKLAGWKMQKVTILGTQPLSCPARPDSQVFFRKPDSGPRDFLPYDKYAGQTGVIVEATMGSYEPEVVIQLDKTSEKIVTKGNDGFAFQSELETAKRLIGRSLWSRGPQSIALKDSPMSQKFRKGAL